jgi:hypothetical protein
MTRAAYRQESGGSKCGGAENASYSTDCCVVGRGHARLLRWVCLQVCHRTGNIAGKQPEGFCACYESGAQLFSTLRC